MDDAYYMRMALSQAQEAFHEDEVPVGAVLVCQDRILAKTHNLTERLVDVTAHAEIQALTAAENLLGKKFLEDCTLYVTLEPCLMCAGALRWARIGRLVWGADDPKQGYRLFAQDALHKKTQVSRGVLEKECQDLMTAFFRSKRS